MVLKWFLNGSIWAPDAAAGRGAAQHRRDERAPAPAPAVAHEDVGRPDRGGGGGGGEARQVRVAAAPGLARGLDDVKLDLARAGGRRGVCVAAERRARTRGTAERRQGEGDYHFRFSTPLSFHF
eukprot:SAG11_NODE_3237_length_2590_cov_1.560418_1_plen_124_part_00